MPGTFVNSKPAMVPQPPPVAPKSGAARVTLQSWQQAQKKAELLSEDLAPYGNHVRCGSVDSVDSNCSSSVSSSSSSSSGGNNHCRQLSSDGEFIPTRSAGRTPSLQSHNPLQFVKVQSPLYKKAEQQIKINKEVKIAKETLKESEEEWQSNLDNWKSRRRRVSEKVIQRAEEMRQIEAEEQLRQLKQKEQQRKIKTFSQIVEKRSSKRNYNLDLYIGQGDDSGVGGTPEPDEQEGACLDNPHLSLRSDTSEGMTSETDSIDSDVHSSEKVIKEPPKVPKKPHSWLARKDSSDSIPCRTSSPNNHSLSGKDLISENISSTEPSDIESHAADTETVSSEDDGGFSQPVRQVDSGLDSLGDSHRPNDTADSASDLSQDSCSGVDKPITDIEPEVASSDEIEEQQPTRQMLKRRPLIKSISIRDEEEDILGNGSDYGEIRISILAKQSLDSKGFGFNLKGGKDQGIDAYIDVVFPGSPADLAGLRRGDKVLSLNGEPAADYSHSSLVFSVKQATYSGELEMIILRPPEEDMSQISDVKKSGKSGTSFAEKIALFSGGSNSGNSRLSHVLKSGKNLAEEEEEAKKSLVLRRRSAFEKGSAETDANRRSFCVSPENVSDGIDERRHSIGFMSQPDKLGDGSTKKPPPVPVKPKLRTKPRLVSQSSINEPDLPEMNPAENVCLNGETFQRFSNGGCKDNGPAEANDFSKLENGCILVNEADRAYADLNPPLSPMVVNQCQDEPPIDVSENKPSEGTIELQREGVSASYEDKLTDHMSLETDPPPPEFVDNDVNNVEEISEKVKSVSLFADPQRILPHDPLEATTDYSNDLGVDVQHVTDSSTKDLSPCNGGCAVMTRNHVLEENCSNAQDSCEDNSVETYEIQANVDENYETQENVDENYETQENAEENYKVQEDADEKYEMQEDADEKYEMQEDADEKYEMLEDADEKYEMREDADEQLIDDSNVSSISREEFVQINMHPLGLPLEKIDEDDGGISASTTPSSETPDTETIIDNLPTNISPLPNDDAIESNSTDGTCQPSGDNDDVLREAALSPLGKSGSEDDELEETVHETQQSALDELVNYSENVSASNASEKTDLRYEVGEEQEYEFEESADQLSPLDVIDQIEMKLMQQLEQDALEDLSESSNGQLEETVHRELLYLSEDADLLDDLDAPRNVVPPSEPPPPPPPEPEISESKANPFQRINSTKRIKKEIWRRRSDFLGLGSPEAITVDDLPPPPPGLEELLKSEMELQREQRLFLEKQLSLVDTEYSTDDVFDAATDSYNPVEEYATDYSLEVLDSEVFDAVTTDAPNENWKVENECQMPESNVEVIETNIETIEKDTSKQSESPQHKAKTHIQTLGAAPRAKIMDSNKWITQTERHVPVLKQKSVEPVFREASYNQNFWVAQDAGRRSSATRSHTPIDRRYSMPPAYGTSRQPNVTVRTWGDRELEYQPQPRPKSAVWQEHPSVAQSYHPPPSSGYGYSESYGSHRSSWSESMSRCVPEESHRYEIRHQCSHCGSPLTEGSAMGIDALQLYFHIECFRCCICHLQLGNGSCGTDVQVKNSHLYCPKCFVLE